MWVDISNYTQELTDAGCAELKAAGIVGCVIQAVTGYDSVTYTGQQLQACQRNGLRIQGYVFPGGVEQKLHLFDSYLLEALWLDVELPISTAGVDQALAACDAYMGGKLTGIYSGHWFFASQGWLNYTRWAHRPLWDSNYTGVAEVGSGFNPYGGWKKPAVTQYRGTSNIGSVHQIDLDIFA